MITTNLQVVVVVIVIKSFSDLQILAVLALVVTISELHKPMQVALLGFSDIIMIFTQHEKTCFIKNLFKLKKLKVI